jgi:hypothetical protein
LILGKNDMQGFKSATTYAKRIGLESVTGVAPDDDDGNAAARNAPRTSRAIPRNEPPHDPETGEVTERTMGDAFRDGMRDAWLDGVKDSLPFDCADMSKLEAQQTGQFWNAVADALVGAFAKLKTPKGVSGQWDKRADLIEEMQAANPPAYHRVQDAFDGRIKELSDPIYFGEMELR